MFRDRQIYSTKEVDYKMEFLIKLFGGYTKADLKKSEDKIKALERDLEEKEEELKKMEAGMNAASKEYQELLTENADLQAKLDAISDKDAKEKAEAERIANEVFMYNSFKDMFYTEDGVKYIDGMSLMNDNSLRAVYNDIWKNDENQKVTFDEFNQEFTKLYHNRNNKDLVDDYLRNQLLQVKYHVWSTTKKDAKKYVYNDQGDLVVKKTGRSVYDR